MPDRPRVRQGRDNLRSRHGLGIEPSDGRQMAARGSRAQRLDGLHDEPRPGAPRTVSDDDVEAVIVKTLEETPSMPPTGPPARWPKRRGMSQSAVSPHLAGVRVEAPSGRHLQALARPAVRGEGARRRRPLRQPARWRPRALRRREDPGPGARSHLARAPDAARAPRAAHPRLRAARHDQPLSPPWTWPRAMSSPT